MMMRRKVRIRPSGGEEEHGGAANTPNKEQEVEPGSWVIGSFLNKTSFLSGVLRLTIRC